MKPFITVQIQVFAMSLLMASPAGSSEVPTGSYSHTCENIKMENERLTAECKTRDGNRLTTSLNNPKECLGDIGNIDGYLTCARGEKLPPNGSYQETCRAIVVKGESITAECKKIDSTWVSTSLNDLKCIGDISNNNGVLKCNNPPATGSGGAKTYEFCIGHRLNDGYSSYNYDLVRAPSGSEAERIIVQRSGFSGAEYLAYVVEKEKCTGTNATGTSQSSLTAQDCSYGSDTCVQGYVWREAFPGDHVCVMPTVREQAKRDNEQAAARRNPTGGQYGPETCLQGYVWRESAPGDHVCVTPDIRSQAATDNAQASVRKACQR